MKSPLLYLLEVLFCSGLLMVFYRLLLQRKVSFVICRRYLVAAVVLSAVIPALNIPLYPARTVVYPLPLIVSAPVEEPAGEVFAADFEPAPAVSAPPVAPAADWDAILHRTVMGLYALTAGVLLALVVMRFVSVRRLRRRSQLTDCGRYTLAEHPSIASPFSFLRTVFLGEGFEERRREIVLHHEASHVIHRHSAERIVVELVRCLFWFNPFVWMAARWLQEVQEWEADHDVLEAGYDLTEYRTIIFRQLFGYNPDIACGLNHSLTKNRFAMMTQFKESRFALVRLGAAIPIVAGMMMLCSFTTRTPDTLPETVAAESAYAGAHCPLVAKTTLGHFGARKNAIVSGQHTGVDIRADEGTHVAAAFDGRVTASEYDSDGRGNYVEIEHKDGLTTSYSHLAARRVDVGDRISAGDVVGTVGSTGRSTGSHLHFEMRRNGEPFDPEQVFDFKTGAVRQSVSESAPVLPGLEKLKPIPVCFSMTGYKPGENGGNRFDLLEFLPVDDTKYKVGKGTATRSFVVTDLKGTDITDWAWKHYAIKSRNPVFIVDGVKMDKEEYVAYTEQRSKKGYKNVPKIVSEAYYAGPEVGRLLGDPTVDALVVVSTEKGAAGQTSLAVPAETAQPAQLSLTGTYEETKQYSGSYEGKKPNLLDAVVTGPVTSTEWTSSDVYTMTGKLEVTFKSDPGMILRCDSLVCMPDRVEARGNASYGNTKNMFVADNFEFKKGPSGKFEWRAERVKGQVQTTAQVRISAGQITFNGQPATSADLVKKIAAWRDALPEKDRANAVITFSADNQTKMGSVTDAKEQIRKAGVLKVNYSQPGQSDLVRILPPEFSYKSENGVKVMPSGDIAIKERNLFVVNVNESGKTLAGQIGAMELVSDEKLTAAIRAFVENASDSSDLPEKQTREFTLPDGRKVSYPVSQGVVSLQVSRDTPYDSFIAAQRQIGQAFDQIRSSVAQQWFGETFASLDDTQRQAVMRAVPLNVSEALPHDISTRKR